MLDLKRELKRRDVSLAELARETGLSRTTVTRLAKGTSAGRPATRRVLRAALGRFPILEENAR